MDRRISRWVGMAFFFLLPLSVGRAAGDAAFLDGPVALKNSVMIGSYAQAFERMGQGAGHRIIPSEEVLQWAKTKKLSHQWNDFAVERKSVRGYLDWNCSSIDLQWTYDPSLDVIRVDFSWHRADPRPTPELLKTVLKRQPPRSFASLKTDAWSDAFNALLSKPENFARVWRLRMVGDTAAEMGIPFTEQAENLCGGWLQDDAGGTHAIILTNTVEMMSPGWGAMTYYLFDKNGRFEKGGVVGTGYRCEEASGWLNPDKKSLTIRMWNNVAYRIDLFFHLTKGGLVFDGTQGTDGVLSPPEKPRPGESPTFGHLFYETE